MRLKHGNNPRSLRRALRKLREKHIKEGLRNKAAFTVAKKAKEEKRRCCSGETSEEVPG
ncbi:MAG: hypothetical protein QXD94_04175 [Sulfolobales archaeon]